MQGKEKNFHSAKKQGHAGFKSGGVNIVLFLFKSNKMPVCV